MLIYTISPNAPNRLPLAEVRKGVLHAFLFLVFFGTLETLLAKRRRQKKNTYQF